jgi:hypothetical protein
MRPLFFFGFLTAAASSLFFIACEENETTPPQAPPDGATVNLDSGGGGNPTDAPPANNDNDNDADAGDPLVTVAAALNGLRWELPCIAAVTDPSLCTTQSTNIVKTATLQGTAGKTYVVKLRFRGVIEPKTYTGGSRVGSFQTGGGPATDTANIYRLTTSAPNATYFVNAGTTRPASALYCETMDYEAAIEIAAGATVTLTAEPLDALQIKNRDQNGQPFVIANVPPAPDPFNGQFVQMDVVSVAEK